MRECCAQRCAFVALFRLAGTGRGCTVSRAPSPTRTMGQKHSLPDAPPTTPGGSEVPRSPNGGQLFKFEGDAYGAALRKAHGYVCSNSKLERIFEI